MRIFNKKVQVKYWLNPFFRVFEPIVEESEPIGQKFLNPFLSKMNPFWNCIKIGYLIQKRTPCWVFFFCVNCQGEGCGGGL